MIQLIVCFLFSLTAYAGQVETPIRTGLGFDSQTAQAFSDENILTSVQYAVENAHVTPVLRIKIEGTSEKIAVSVVGEGEGEAKQFAFKVVGGEPVHEKGPLIETIVHQVDIPFGNLQTFGFQQSEGWGYSSAAAWIAVGVVGVYAAKKILNKLTVGKFSAGGDHEHESLFPAPEQMRRELKENRALMDKAVAKAEEALDGQLLAIVKPLAQAATCGHDHAPTDFKCKRIGRNQIDDARQSLLRSFPRYAAAFGRDFYQELVEPVVGLVKAVKDKSTRKQVWNFFDLISRRMIKERGVGPAVATGIFVGTGQLIIETLESFVMPAGAHLFCQVGNAAVLAIAAKAYTTYFCMIQNNEFKDKTMSDRWRVAQEISRLSKVNASPENPEQKTIYALNLLFRLVERDLRHARNLENIGLLESRELARRLGDLRRGLTILSIRVLNKTATDGEALAWLKDLYWLQSVLHDTKACAEILQPAA